MRHGFFQSPFGFGYVRPGFNAQRQFAYIVGLHTFDGRDDDTGDAMGKDTLEVSL